MTALRQYLHVVLGICFLAFNDVRNGNLLNFDFGHFLGGKG